MCLLNNVAFCLSFSLATERDQLNSVFENLSEKGQKWIYDKPSREFRIFASRSLKTKKEEKWEFYTNTEEVKVTGVCEKTKYKYWWNRHGELDKLEEPEDDFIVEITKYVYWNCEKIFSNVKNHGIECVIDDSHPMSVSWG
ncbi:1509_t:CDS:2, partial [Acaulospora colombiana]